MYKIEAAKLSRRPEKEAIHSGHFMVSHFEAEAQDDEDELAVPVPEVIEIKNEIAPVKVMDKGRSQLVRKTCHKSQIGIETNLSKLFQCMSLAYRQKLTSPKWNRFRGVRLRWKDKIRLNNVIWRCWHMQFIKKENTLICQFASPLDVDTHNKPEAVVLEGKYWKRKLAAVTAEYKKWRMFYRNQALGHNKDATDMLTEMELISWNSQHTDDNIHMMVDEDYMGLMSDTLFSTITNQPFAFPDSREIAKAGLADFIQPSLGPLQPNLDDYMDTFEPLQEFITGKLATVPEEHNDNLYKHHHQTWSYSDLDLMGAHSNHDVLPTTSIISYQPLMNKPIEDTRQQFYTANETIYTQPQMISKVETKANDMKTVALFGKNFQNTFATYVDTVCSNQDQGSYKLNQINSVDMSQGYKFTTPTAPNVKFTSQVSNNYKQLENKEDKPIVIRKNARGRPRSRSNTREPMKKPPLISAVSDPSLLNSTNSALLTQLLTNTNSNSFVQNQHETIRVKDENVPIAILPQPSAPTTLIITPLNMPTHTNITDPLLLNTMNSSNSPILDNQCLNSPTSSQGSIGSPTRDPLSQRRVGHIHAEQKRRYNIKNGFDMIHSLIPHLNQNPNAKLSKAAMLQKGAEYIKQLRSERHSLKEEMDSLRQQIETLNTAISNCQSLLPATGAPVSRRRDNKMQEMFDEYVRTRTLENWKFWIFSLLFRPLLASFNNVVSTSSIEDLYRSTLLWVEQHCTLADLRPVVLNSLRYLCTKTDMLSDPEKLPEEARQIVLSEQNPQEMRM